MTDTVSLNYLGAAGGARVEKPQDYYGRIDNAKNVNTRNKKVNQAQSTNSASKTNFSKNTQNTPSSSFDTMLKKIQASKNKSKNKVQDKTLGGSPINHQAQANTAKQNMPSINNITQMQYDAARQKLSNNVVAKITKMAKTKNISNGSDAHKNSDSTNKDKNGIDIALKKVAIEYEEQIYGIIWNMIFTSGDREYQGGLGEEIFHKELIAEMQKHTNTGRMGPIAESIYNDMVRKRQKNGSI